MPPRMDPPAPAPSTGVASDRSASLRSLALPTVQRRFRKPGKSPKQHVEGTTRLALGHERLLVGQPVLMKVVVLLPPTSRHLLSSDQDREEGPVAGDGLAHRSQLVHDFQWADGRKPGKDVAKRDRAGPRRPRNPPFAQPARYPIPGHSANPSRSSVEPAARWLERRLRARGTSARTGGCTLRQTCVPPDACWFDQCPTFAVAPAM